jgi:hypothetical protein
MRKYMKVEVKRKMKEVRSRVSEIPFATMIEEHVRSLSLFRDEVSLQAGLLVNQNASSWLASSTTWRRYM